MSILHTVNKSPFEKNSLNSCLQHVKIGSAVLLMEDGVYGVLKNASHSAAVKVALGVVKVYALKPDLDTRGIGAAHIMEGIELVEYGGFVDLVQQHNTVQSWL